ncbi:hypothetical protein Leryth_015816 [Lithospermum erythrorhizon]|nr:hypothetical protein Leryth_015816 [Lithospermum erythrorhizon]
MRTLFFLIRTLHKTHRIIAFAPHLNPIPKLNPHVPFVPFYQTHFIAAFYQTATRPFHANQENLHHLIKLPDFGEYVNQNNQIDQLGIHDFSQSIQKTKDFASGDEAISFLDDLGAKPTKRVWREMSKNCILPDGASYVHMISCFSKVGNLFDSLRLYDEMQKRGWIPGAEVYNSLIYVLTSENCLNEALKIVDRMKETGLQPNSSTYNSMILPLCDAMKTAEAKTVLAMMIEDNAGPTIDTYHAFLGNGNFEITLEVLNNMKDASLGPTNDTFLIVLDKLFKLKQPGNALKIWEEMDQYNIIPGQAHYNAMMEGLVKHGLLVEAKRFHMEIISKGMLVDPKLNKLIEEPVDESCHNKGRRKLSSTSTRHIKRSKQKQYGNSSSHRSQRAYK